MSRIVTFYSYKGGVGRTFVMANIAVLLARRGLRILIMDWDLEAPGLDRFFRPWITGQQAMDKGVLPMLRAAAENPATTWEDHVTFISGLKQNATISLISSGATSQAYAQWLHEFSWDRFFGEKAGGIVLERWREEWKKAYDFILIDSRTGLSDIGGVCTILLPDILAAVFTASHQSARGVRAVIDSAQSARRKLQVTRLPMTILPIPARFDGREEVDLGEKWLNEFAEIFGPVMQTWLPASVPPRDMLVKLKVPYVARFSFGEELAVETHGIDNSDLPGYSIALSAKLIGSGFEDAATLTNASPVKSTPTESDSIAGQVLKLVNENPWNPFNVKSLLTAAASDMREDSSLAVLVGILDSDRFEHPQHPDVGHLLRHNLEIAEHRFVHAPEVVATAKKSLGMWLLENGQIEEAQTLLASYLQTAEKHRSKIPMWIRDIAQVERAFIEALLTLGCTQAEAKNRYLSLRGLDKTDEPLGQP